MTVAVHHQYIRPDRTHLAARSVYEGRRPNYTLRRTIALAAVLLAVAIAAQVAIGAVGALAGLDSRPAAASEAEPAASETAAIGEVTVRSIHVAEPGESLWSVADIYRGDIDRGRYVDRLISLNGGTSIEVGQAIRLP
jgi:hypothetical protein